MILPICVVLGFAKLAHSANILFIGTIPSPSHHIWNRVLALSLVKNGHNVTFYTSDKDSTPKTTNYTHHRFEGVYEKMNELYSYHEMGDDTALEQIILLQDWSVAQCEFVAQSSQYQNLINAPKSLKFDAIIIDVTCGTCAYPFIHKFGYPPTIGVTAFLLPSYISHFVGNPLHPTLFPMYGLPYTTDMIFTERLWNSIFTYGELILKNIRQGPSEYKVLEKYFKDLPPMAQLERHISLVLANTDPILDYPQPLPPNIIPIGGLHTTKSNPLPEEFQTLLDDCKNGAIIFSLGTNIRSDQLGPEVQKELLKAFSKLKETVFWKFESDLSNLPSNVIVRKWLPQNILEHPNIKLFIGHGGALSTQEAIYHGIPIVTIPFLLDQIKTSNSIIKKKIGTTIRCTQIKEKYVLEKVAEVLNNPMYRDNVKKLSAAFRDRPETALERAIFWIEYVIRHKNADFLSLPSRDMPLYKSTGLDLILTVAIILFVSISLLCKVFKSLCRIGKKEKIE